MRAALLLLMLAPLPIGSFLDAPAECASCLAANPKTVAVLSFDNHSGQEGPGEGGLPRGSGLLCGVRPGWSFRVRDARR